MFESYPNIEYDENTRRINRRMKFLGVLIGLVAIGGLIALGEAAEDATRDTLARVNNDTNGTVTCGAFYRVGTSDRQLRETGRLSANGNDWVVYGSSCSVFDRDGNYVSCLRIRHGSGDGDEQFLASGGDRRVKADACVYPR